MRVLLIAAALFVFAQSQQKCSRSTMEQNSMNSAQPTPEKTMNDQKFEDLPDGIKATDEVKFESKTADGEPEFKIISVSDALIKIGAKYENEKLVDKNGREIKFYKPPVRGVSQGFEEDKKQREEDEKQLRELKEKFTVLVIYVNPMKVM